MFRPIALPLDADNAGILRSDWAPLLTAMCDETISTAQRAAIFHASLAGALVDQAVAVRARTGVTRVGLCGGVFQNRVLTELAAMRLDTAGFDVLIAAILPVNDAAISFGQIVEAAAADPGACRQ